MTSIYKNTQYNGKVEDNLLLNGDTSFFQDTGYVRHSNFCQSYIDQVKPCKLGQTVTWTLPKGVDLLGWTDLIITLNRPKTITSNSAAGNKTHCAWVECLGYAMIEKATLSIGNGGTIETLTGEQMNIINELFKDKEKRLNNHVLRTGVTAFPTELVSTVDPDGAGAGARPTGQMQGKHHVTTRRFNGGVGAYEHNRFSRYLGMSDGTDGEIPNKEPLELIVPLQWFFGRSGPSKNLPIGPIAQSSDITLTIKFRPVGDLITYFPDFAGTAYATGTGASPDPVNTVPTFTWENDEVVKDGTAKIRCQVTAVSAAESAQLTNQEHVRLNTLWAEPTSQVEKVTLQAMIPVTKAGTPIEVGTINDTLDGTVAGWKAPANTGKKIKIPLNLLHPVKEIIFTIRKVHEIRPTKGKFGQFVGDDWATSSDNIQAEPGQTHLMGRNYFAYQGGMLDPNVDSPGNTILNASADDGAANLVTNTAEFPRPICQTFYGMDNLKLIVNSGNYHNDLEGGLDRAYLMERIMPSQHSGCSTTFTRASLKHINSSSTQMEAMHDLKMLAGDQDRKEIYSFSFALSPESDNPSGHLNFSSVSTASLEFTLYGYHNTWISAGKTVEEDVQIDVYPLYHNWIQMHDGRAHLSFQ